MAGNKTHKQQIRIIEERVNTKNADDDFDVREDLKRSDEEEERREEAKGKADNDR